MNEAITISKLHEISSGEWEETIPGSRKAEDHEIRKKWYCDYYPEKLLNKLPEREINLN